MTTDLFKPYLEKIEDQTDRTKVRQVYKWIEEEFPELQHEVKMEHTFIFSSRNLYHRCKTCEETFFN